MACNGGLFLITLLSVSVFPEGQQAYLTDLRGCQTQSGIIDLGKCILSGIVSSNFQVAQNIQRSVKTMDGLQWSEENKILANRSVTCKQVNPGVCSPARSCYYSLVYQGCVMRPSEESKTSTSSLDKPTVTALPSTTTAGSSVDCILVGWTGCLPKDLCEFSFDNQGCVVRPEATTPQTEVTTASVGCQKVGADECSPKDSCVFSGEIQSCFSNCTQESSGCIPEDICSYSEELQHCVLDREFLLKSRTKRAPTECNLVGASGCTPKNFCMYSTELQTCILKPELTTTTEDATTTDAGTTTVAIISTTSTTVLSTTTTGNGCVQVGGSGCTPKDTCIYSMDLKMCILRPELTTQPATTTTVSSTTTKQIQSTTTEVTIKTTPGTSTTTQAQTTTANINGCVLIGQSECLPSDTCAYSTEILGCVENVATTTGSTPWQTSNSEEGEQPPTTENLEVATTKYEPSTAKMLVGSGILNLVALLYSV